jgi:hypothetical protein
MQMRVLTDAWYPVQRKSKEKDDTSTRSFNRPAEAYGPEAPLVSNIDRHSAQLWMYLEPGLSARTGLVADHLFQVSGAFGYRYGQEETISVLVFASLSVESESSIPQKESSLSAVRG